MGVGILGGVQNKYNCEEEDMMGKEKTCQISKSVVFYNHNC